MFAYLISRPSKAHCGPAHKHQNTADRLPPLFTDYADDLLHNTHFLCSLRNKANFTPQLLCILRKIEAVMTRSAELGLRELANNQGGYFTARQAEGLGFVRNHHSYHVSAGNWTREAHGIYRLAGVPSTNPVADELHRWLLWSMGRKADKPRGAIAYETALVVYGLSDLMLNKVHLTVPKDFRPSVIPEGVVLHRENRDITEMTEREGLRIVRPFIAVLDLIREGRISVEHIERGFKDAIRKGVITSSEVKKAALLSNEQLLIDAWLREAA